MEVTYEKYGETKIMIQASGEWQIFLNLRRKAITENARALEGL